MNRTTEKASRKLRHYSAWNSRRSASRPVPARMEASRCCSGCGAVPQEGGAKLQACSLCRSEGLPPSFFCGERCLRAAWPHHREWHREQERLHGLALQVAARHWSLSAAAPCSAYDELLSAMGAMSGQCGQHDPAQPRQGAGAASSDVALAVTTFLLAAEQHTDPASLRWAERCIAAYALRSQPDCLACAPPPPWWTDAELVSLSARVVAARPDLPLAWRMRGEVLSGRLGQASWCVGPRSPDELEEAGHALQRSLALGQHELAEADRETLVRHAHMCFHAAQTMRDAG